MSISTLAQLTHLLDPSFGVYPFASVLQPLIIEALTEHNQMKWRQSTILIAPVVVWLVLGLVMRRDKNAQAVLSWMVSGFRWLKGWLPAQNQLVAEGTISHARKRVGVAVFRDLFRRVTELCQSVEPDFHGWITATFDGTTGSMPDTASNQRKFGKPWSRTGRSGYPQMRIMTLMITRVRMIVDVAQASYTGKGTGEKNLIRQILSHLRRRNLLILMDAGLYAFDILWSITQQECGFLLKVPRSVTKLKPLRYLPDGSYIVMRKGKILDPTVPPTPSGRRTWLHHELAVRIIPVEIPGFRPFLLMTTLLDETIDARTIACHYHRRWDIETAYDEIKTHQCAAQRGQMPTTFRSKRPDLVLQELYALLIVYNTTRYIIWQAAKTQDLDPCRFSFLAVWQHLLDAAPLLSVSATLEPQPASWPYLLELIADCLIDQPHRHRAYPRVVKVKMSKFARKKPADRATHRDFAAELTVTTPPPLETSPSAPGDPLLPTSSTL